MGQDISVQHATDLPEGAGKQIVEMACTECHGLDYVTKAHYNKEEWQDVITRMQVV